MTKVLVIAEHRDGAIVKATLSAVTAAKTIVDATGGSFDIGIVGGTVSALAEQLTAYGASSVHTVQSGTLEGYTAQAYAQPSIRSSQPLVRTMWSQRRPVSVRTSCLGLQLDVMRGWRATWSGLRKSLARSFTRDPCGRATSWAK